MNRLSFLIILLASIPGTVIMTSVMYLYHRLLKEETRVIHVFGSMLICDKLNLNQHTRILLVGSIAHFSVGFLFSLGYFLMWNWGIFNIVVKDTLILGALSGVAAIIVWNLYFLLHLHSPRLSRMHYSAALFIAHLFFAAVTVYFFDLLNPAPKFYYELTD